ncbi:conserved hypothetical protein [Roseobacter sp. GAI101]|nr:conserved hypothetical protein [Roseobacter sp. GAI101]
MPFAALFFEVIVERCPTRKAGHWYHEVTTRIADETFDFTFIVPLSGATVSVSDHVMRQHRAEPLCSLTFAIRHDLCNQATVIVVEHRLWHRSKERKRVNMPIQPSLGVRGRIGTDITGITMRQIQREEIGFLLNATNHNQRFAKVGLRMSGRMAQRHEHLTRTALLVAHIIFDDGVPAVEAAFITEPFKNALGCVSLLTRAHLVFRQPPINLIDICIQLRAFNRRRPPVSRRLRMRQHLRNTVPADPKIPSYLPPAQPILKMGATHLQI